jgi:protein-L-isoaspartate(D-aspartate) O-methyltransferase
MTRRLFMIAMVPLALIAARVEAQGPGYAAERRDMVRQIERIIAVTAPMTGIAMLDARVASSFATVERHRFVPDALAAHAYADTPLPLGHGQALTQPFLAALMTQALRLEPGARVFETGTDCGYHAAILAELGAEVFTMEIIEPLHALARLHLRDWGRVRLRLGDGYYGWAAEAPFDAMLIKNADGTAARRELMAVRFTPFQGGQRI